MNKIKTFKNGNTQSTIEVARGVSRSLGMGVAARMLLNRGYSIEAALFILLGV